MKALSDPEIFSSELYQYITPSRHGASYSGTGCVLQRMFQFLFIHVCSGISGSASMRLLRLDNACSAECQQLLYSTEIAWSVCRRYDSVLWNSSCCFIYIKVCTGYVFFGMEVYCGHQYYMYVWVKINHTSTYNIWFGERVIPGKCIMLPACCSYGLTDKLTGE